MATCEAHRLRPEGQPFLHRAVLPDPAMHGVAMEGTLGIRDARINRQDEQ